MGLAAATVVTLALGFGDVNASRADIDLAFQVPAVRHLDCPRK
jgi:hypothetical protein